MSVSDNGIGLDHDRFEAFLTLDTAEKLAIGGKGVGRLTWLKVFAHANIVSRYQTNTGTERRSFKFTLDKDNPLQEFKIAKTSEQIGTEVSLHNMRLDYNTHCPAKIETIAKKIIAHFFPAFFSKEMPSISVTFGDETIILDTLLHEKIYRQQKTPIKIEDHTFEIEHSLIDKSISDHFDQHTLQFSANERIVEDHALNNQIGISTYIDVNGNPTRYVGVVTSTYLDSHVSQERNRFDIEDGLFSELVSRCVSSVKDYLKEEIENVIEKQTTRLATVVTNFPRFSYLVRDRNDFVRTKLPLNANTEEDIFKQLSVLDFRASRDIVGEIKQASAQDAGTNEEALVIHSKELVGRIQQQERAALLEYIAKRKLILDLLSKYQGYDEEDDRQNFVEKAVHEIICPTRITKNDIDIFDHNLWVIDDRLTFYEFWASDKDIQSFAKDSQSQDRPDLVLFKGNTLFHRPGMSQPVVIVEFKRPARKKYSDEENPITQIYKYIRELRGKEVRDKSGALVTGIDERTPFFCYVVADITTKLEQFLVDQQIDSPLPGGRGFFGYHSGYNAYIEVIHYSKFIEDARLRNEIFFKKLGIN